MDSAVTRRRAAARITSGIDQLDEFHEFAAERRCRSKGLDDCRQNGLSLVTLLQAASRCRSALGDVESQSARAFTAANACAPAQPQERRAVDPARELVAPGDTPAFAWNLLLANNHAGFGRG